MSDKLVPAVFLDRDGVINYLLHEVPDERHNPHNYVLSWDSFKFIPEAIEGLKLLAKTDYKIFVVSNQSGIDRGWVNEDLFLADKIVSGIFDRMRYEINVNKNGRIDDYRFCPHDTDAGCCCRKPQPGLIYYLAVRYNIDLYRSWMVGDSDSDIAAGHNAGTNLIRIHDPKYSDIPLNDRAQNRVRYGEITALLVANLLEAAEIIVNAQS